MDTYSDEIEMLARMWIDCDPNRQPDSGDEIITMHDPVRDVPRWHWFVNRAEASAAYFKAHGYRLVKSDG